MIRLVMLVLAALAPCGIAADVFPGLEWESVDPETLGIDRAQLDSARNVALIGGGAGLVIYRGHLIYAWGNPHARYDVKSTTKSIGVTTLGLAMLDGLLGLDDNASAGHPEFATPPSSNAGTGWIDGITLGHLGTQSAGFPKNGGYSALVFEPGSAWAYSDGGPNWLGEVVTLAYGQDLWTLLKDRILTPIGAHPNDLTWRNHAYRPHLIEGIKRRELASGISTTVDAMARIGSCICARGSGRESACCPRVSWNG